MQDSKIANIELMENTPMPKAILRLAIPTVFSTVISIVYNLTDTYFIGLLDDPVQLGAISLAFPVFTFLQAIGNMFGLGAPSYMMRLSLRRTGGCPFSPSANRWAGRRPGRKAYCSGRTGTSVLFTRRIRQGVHDGTAAD